MSEATGHPRKDYAYCCSVTSLDLIYTATFFDFLALMATGASLEDVLNNAQTALDERLLLINATTKNFPTPTIGAPGTYFIYPSPDVVAQLPPVE